MDTIMPTISPNSLKNARPISAHSTGSGEVCRNISRTMKSYYGKEGNVFRAGRNDLDWRYDECGHLPRPSDNRHIHRPRDMCGLPKT